MIRLTEKWKKILLDIKKSEDIQKSNFCGAYNALKKLSDLGLVVQEARVEGVNTVNRIRVTEKGINVGKKLIKVKEGI